jgi:hypothetical protein
VESTGTQLTNAVFKHCIRTLGERSVAAISGQPLAERSNHRFQVKAVLRHRPHRPASFLDGLRGDGADRGNDDPVHRRIECGRPVKFPRDLLKPTWGKKEALNLRGSASRSRIRRGRKGPGGAFFKPQLILLGSNMGYDVTALS